MPTQWTSDTVFTTVQGVLMDSLGVEREEVKRSSRVIGDLRAESLDFLDIILGLEKKFQVRIPRGELFPPDIINDTSVRITGRLTKPIVAKLQQHPLFSGAPVLDGDELQFADLVTVELLCRYLERKLGVVN